MRQEQGHHGQITLLITAVLLFSPSVRASCPTYAAWLDSSNEIHTVYCAGVPCKNLKGFAAVSLSPDGTYLDITLQVQATPDSAAIPLFLPPAIYGPYSSTQEAAAGVSPLLTLSTPFLSLDQSLWSSSARAKPSDLPKLMDALRNGLAYITVPTDRVPAGELRGQLQVVTCLEAELRSTTACTGAAANLNPYAFANVLLSADQTMSATIIQLPRDPTRSIPSPVSVEVISTANVQLAKLQTQQYSSCVVGTFNGLKADVSTPCSLDEKHTYPAEINYDSSVNKIYHVQYTSAGDFLNSTVTVTTSATGTCTDQLVGHFLRAIPCRRLLQLHDNLFSIASNYKSDWITIWSLNQDPQPINPDFKQTLVPRYYAHPYYIVPGENSLAISRRFGMTTDDILRLNPGLKDTNSLPVGSTICVIPNWQAVTAGNGQRICI